MEGIWNVASNGQTVGSCAVERQGLYYRISCQCRFPDREMRCLMVSVGSWQQDLGVLVPEGGAYVVRKRIKCAAVPEGKPTFAVKLRRPIRGDTDFSPIYPEEPFSYLSRLEEAFLVRKNGVLGLEFQGQRVRESS